jgi:4-amino-4-deoxy-L-arabinose transferase-like glycosyltransferase
VYLVFRRVRASAGSEGGWIAVSVLLATPGVLFYAATAFAEVPAFLLALVTSLAAARASGGRLPWWLVVGALAGLAAATRLNGVLLLPSLLVLAWPSKDGGSRSLRDVGLAAVLGALVLVACLWVQAQTGTVFAAEDAQASAGLSSLLPRYPTVLNGFLVGSHFAPLPLLVAATGGALWASERERSGGAGPIPWRRSKFPSAATW